MSLTASLEHFFKPEVRKHGEEILSKGTLALSSGSDVGIDAFVRASTPTKVKLTANHIGSSTFTATCTCTSGTKGILCKHIWATLLAAEKRYPDFFDSKSVIETQKASPAPESPYKAKQTAYKKAQYEKQKLRAKEIRQSIKKKSRGEDSAPSYPEDVARALQYFSENGFTFAPPWDLEEIKTAKKKLARIFHPDKGGTQEESTLLNKHFEILSAFAGH